MTAFAVFGAGLALLAAAVVWGILSGARGDEEPRTEHERSDARRLALEELEFDYLTGKVAEEDYDKARQRLSGSD
ncbi:MAG: hypothetical protein J4G03_05795 [Gemmatimonadetes bacterium]|nr:hypothetical protein [Gemmatimonadota bacterium]